MKLTTVGIDLEKNLFQVHGIDEHGKVLAKKQLRRDQMTTFFMNLSPCLIGMEACGGAHHWAQTCNQGMHAACLRQGRKMRNMLQCAAALLLVTSALSGCGGGNSSNALPLSTTPFPPTPQLTANPPMPDPTNYDKSAAIKVLSSRADLISGSQAYIELVPPEKTSTGLKVFLNNQDISARFAQRSEQNQRILGLVTGLALGRNVLRAQWDGGGAELALESFSLGGPILAGKQMTPWICMTSSALNAEGLVPSALPEDPMNSKCNAKPSSRYIYLSTANQWHPWDASVADRSIKRVKKNEGTQVRMIALEEVGTVDRGTYRITVLHDPADALPWTMEDASSWTPWKPAGGWNGKLVMKFGASSGTNHNQSMASPETRDEGILAEGFMVATGSLNSNGENVSIPVSAEALMMLKEHIVEKYGEIRYTIGIGASGGAIQQYGISANYPGLIDGLLPSIGFPDMGSALKEVADHGLLADFWQTVGDRYYGSQLTPPIAAYNPFPDSFSLALLFSLASAPPGYNATKMPEFAPVMGSTPLTSGWWQSSRFLGLLNPSINSDGPAGCKFAVGSPEAANIFNPTTNPTGIRCSMQDLLKGLLGTDAQGTPALPYDNTGVVYGLIAYQKGQISKEHLVWLNAVAGGLDGLARPTRPVEWLDQWNKQSFVPVPRSAIDEKTLRNAYRSGLVTPAAAWKNVPIIDMRSSFNHEIHTVFHSFSARARMDEVNGGHGNQTIWIVPRPLPIAIFDVPNAPTWSATTLGCGASEASSSAPCKTQSPLLVMDRWLGAIHADGRAVPLAQKVIDNKPEEAADACISSTSRVNNLDCARVFGSPRLAAGEPLTHDILKCQLKELSSGDFPQIAQDAYLWKTFQDTFKAGQPDGKARICDWGGELNLDGVTFDPNNPVPTIVENWGVRKVPRKGVGQDTPAVPWLVYPNRDNPNGAADAVPLGEAPVSKAI